MVTLSQRVQEVREGSVPSVRVVQVTRVSRAPHHHHPVVGQVAEVPERHLSQLSVLVPVNDQGGDLEDTQDKKNVLTWTGASPQASVGPVAASPGVEGVMRGSE